MANKPSLGSKVAGSAGGVAAGTVLATVVDLGLPIHDTTFTENIVIGGILYAAYKIGGVGKAKIGTALAKRKYGR
jgi:hypothetical protein